MRNTDRDMIYQTMCTVNKIHRDLSFEMSCLETLAKKRVGNVEEIAALKAKLEAYDRFLNLLDTANPSFGDPGNIVIRYNGELYSTEKWNVEATDVNSEDYTATKRLHLTLKCID